MARISLQAAHDQARRWIESNDSERAIGLAQHILETYPQNLETYRILGEAYLADRQLDRAREAFERVLRSDPENIPAHVGLGIAYERQQQLDRAIPEFEQAWEIKPDMAELRSQLLRLYTEGYGSENAQLRLSRAGLARLYAKGHMLPQAISEFRQVLADQPDRYDAHVALAEALWRDGQDEEAADEARAILKQRPETLKANLLLGYLQQGNSDTYWANATAMDPYQSVAGAMFDALPVAADSPEVDEWNEQAWRDRMRREQEEIDATRPIPVTVGQNATESSAPATPSLMEQPRGSAQPAFAPDDFLASLLGMGAGAAVATAAQPEPETTEPDTDSWWNTPESGTPALPDTTSDEPAMEPFSLADLGLSDEEIAALDTATDAPAATDTSSDEPEMTPFSLADLGLSDEEIAALNDLGDTENLDRDIPSSLQPFSLDQLDLHNDEMTDEGELPASLQPFSLDDIDMGTPPAGTPILESNMSTDQSSGFSWQEPAQRSQTGFSRPQQEESANSELSIFAKLKQRKEAEITPPEEQPLTNELDDNPRLFSLDDVSLRQDDTQSALSGTNATREPSQPIQAESIEEALSSGEIKPFGFGDLGLSDEELAALGLSDSASTPAQEPAMSAMTISDGDATTRPFTIDELGLSDDELAALGLASPDSTTSSSVPSEPASEVLSTDIKPFSLSDLGLSDDEVAALGFGQSVYDTPSNGFMGTDDLAGIDLGSDWELQSDDTRAPRDEAAERLIALGQAQGYIDIADIIAAVDDPDAAEERIEEIGRKLHEARIEIRDGDEIIDMDADYTDEATGGAAVAGSGLGLMDVGLSDEELAALGITEASILSDEPSKSDEPEMTPFSLADLGLSEDEINSLDLGDSGPAAPTSDEPEMTPFSLAELGLSEDEIAAIQETEPEATAEEPASAISDPAAVAGAGLAGAAIGGAASGAIAGSGSAGGRSDENTGDPRIDMFLSRLATEPENHTLRLAVARASGNTGMIDLAIKQYRQLIKHTALLDQVVEDVTDLIDYAPDQKTAQRLYRLLGDIYTRQGDINRAIDAYSWPLGK